MRHIDLVVETTLCIVQDSSCLCWVSWIWYFKTNQHK